MARKVLKTVVEGQRVFSTIDLDNGHYPPDFERAYEPTPKQEQEIDRMMRNNRSKNLS